METWKQIPGYSGYEVSDEGRVRGKLGRIMALRDKGGYRTVGVYIGTRPEKGKWQKQPSVHRLVMRAFVGPCPTGMEVNHKDGIPSNNHLSNLEYVTPSQNVKHGYDLRGFRKKPWVQGSKHGLAKLTESQVVEIRAAYSSGQGSQRMIADKFGVCAGTVNKIVRREYWSHVA